MSIHTTPRAGLLIGYGAISAFLNIDPRDATALVADRTIPTFRVGDLIVARRVQLEALAVPSPPPEPHPNDWRAVEAQAKANGDMLEGLAEIAAFLNATLRQARAFLAEGMPSAGSGADLRASKAAIGAWINQLQGRI